MKNNIEPKYFYYMIKNTKTDLPSTQYWKIKLNKNIILKNKIERKNVKQKKSKSLKKKKSY